MSALTLNGRQRNVALSCDALPKIVDGVQSLDVVRVQGEESLETASFTYKILLKTPADLGGYTPESVLSFFDLSALLGQSATIHIALEGFGAFIYGQETITDMTPVGAGERFISGVIESAQFKRIAERSIFIEITLREWLFVATLNKQYKVFQNLSHLDTIRQVLEGYPYHVESRISRPGDHPVRDYCVQYGEDDNTFVRRLCAENGIAISYEHENGICRLVLSDNNGAFKPHTSEAYHRLRYHANVDRVDEEVFSIFSPIDTLTTGAVTYRDYSYTQSKATNEVSRNEGRQDKKGKQIRHADAEQYHFQSDAFSNLVQPRAGTGGENQPEAEGKLFTLAHLQSLQQHSKRAYAFGNLRALVTGCIFDLTEHPQADSNITYLTVSSKLLIEEVAHETQRTTGSTNVLTQAGQQWKVESSAIVQPLSLPYRPERNIAKPSIHSVEIAKVVGDEGKGEDGEAGNSIWTDDLGRIKIQFPWDREGQSNQDSSCWVRVSSNDAGNQMGGVHLPRIGQEVIISFIKGDPDLPVCTGRIYNSDTMPPWQLPANQALSGYRSRELSPGNQSSGMSNHLILDDSKDEIQTQLKSDFKSTSLSMGSVTRIENNKGRQEKRGFGYELRTDGHGAIRAKDGLFISTDPRPNAAKHITDLKETGEQLTKAQEQHQSMSEVAIEHGAHDKGVDQDLVNETLKEQNQQIKGTGEADPQAGTFPELNAPHLVLSSPVGIETSTPQSTHIWSGEHIALTSGDHTSLSVGKSLLASAVETIRFFVYKAGMRLIAAAGDIDIKALKDSVNVMAKLNITHNANKIIITAKEEVLIIGGGSYSKWNGGGIEHGTNGAWVEHAAAHLMPGPKSKGTSLPGKQIGKGQLELNKVYKDDGDKTVEKFATAAYQVIDALGAVKKGKLDKQGQAKVNGLAVGPAKVKIEKDPRKGWEKAQNFGQYQWPKSEATAEQAAEKSTLMDNIGGLTNLAGQAGQLVGAAAGLTGSSALGSIAQGLGGVSNLASGLSQGGAMGLLTSAAGVASSYVPGLSGVAQGLQTAQGLSALASPSASLPAPSETGRIDMTGRTPGFAG
jgi:type VI secretion system secreted protein VgrG